MAEIEDRKGMTEKEMYALISELDAAVVRVLKRHNIYCFPNGDRKAAVDMACDDILRAVAYLDEGDQVEEGARHE